MDLHVAHRTLYRFDAPRRRLIQSHRMTPASFDGQDVREWRIDVVGGEVTRGAAFTDGAGDHVETVTLRGPLLEVSIEVTGVVATTDRSGVVQGLRAKVPPAAYLQDTWMTAPDPDLHALAKEATSDEDGDLGRGHALCRAVRAAIAYAPGTTESQTTAAQALAQGSGVCQDQTHALIAAARAVGIPGRYVTGYLHSTSDGEAHQASHAWAELWIEGLGWTGFDATNACCPDERYIRVGCGLDAIAAAPIRGRASGTGTETLSVELTVTEAAQ